MNVRIRARALAITVVVALSVPTVPALAAEPLATVTLGAADVLTLPAGDGVRDAALVSVSSDVATTVDAHLRRTGSTDRVVTFDPIEIHDPATAASLTVTVGDLEAGEYELIAVPSAGPAASIPVSVGSGEPLQVEVALSALTIFTWTTASPTSATATIRARDETGLPVPFTGTATAALGESSTSIPVHSATGAEVGADFSASTLGAGTHTVTASATGPSGVEYTSEPAHLTVSDEALASVSITTDATLIFPTKDGYRDGVAITVIPATSTGTVLPASGTVTVSSTRLVHEWTLDSTAPWTGHWDGLVRGALVPGQYLIKVRLTGPGGTVRSAEKSITVRATYIEGVTVKTSLATVLPVKDNYRDTVTFTGSSVTSTGTTIAATGSVKVSRSGTTVRSWPLTSSANWRFTWDGRVAGAVVPGTYTVTVSLKGADGYVQTRKIYVNVSGKKVVTATRKITYTAREVIYLQTPSARGSGECWADVYVIGDVRCTTARSGASGVALNAYGFGNVPAPVTNGHRFGKVSVKVSATFADVSGTVRWCTSAAGAPGECTQSARAYEGTPTLAALTIPKGAQTVSVNVKLPYSSRAYLTRITMTYTFKKLA